MKLRNAKCCGTCEYGADYPESSFCEKHKIKCFTTDVCDDWKEIETFK